MKTTEHFERALSERDIRREWCKQVVDHPVEVMEQPNGRVRFWGLIEETGRYLRVVLLEDQETFHTAMWDRNFGRRRSKG